MNNPRLDLQLSPPKRTTAMMFGMTKQFLQKIDEKAEALANGVSLKGMKDEKPRRIKIPPPRPKKKPERPMNIKLDAAIIKMKHRKELIVQKAEDEEAKVDFKKFKKQEEKKAKAEF